MDKSKHLQHEHMHVWSSAGVNISLILQLTVNKNQQLYWELTSDNVAWQINLISHFYSTSRSSVAGCSYLVKVAF